VRATVDAFGPADLTIPNGLAPNEDQILTNFLGAPFAQLSTSRLLSASTTSYARSDASVLILHGTADPFVSIENSEHLFSALANADVQFIRVVGGGHDDSTFHSPQTWPATLQFFQQRIGGATSEDTPTSLNTTTTSSPPPTTTTTTTTTSQGE
jgi:pimeloyl-ACP methyl ester carboxylesterase